MGASGDTVAWHVTITDTENMSEISEGFTIDRDRGVYVSSSRCALAHRITTTTGLTETDALAMLTSADQLHETGRFIIYAAALTLADLHPGDDQGENV
jgi:hypothetical protein